MKQSFCFFFLSCSFGKHFDYPITDTRLILAIAISTGVPMIAVQEQRQTPLLPPGKTSTAFSA